MMAGAMPFPMGTQPSFTMQVPMQQTMMMPQMMPQMQAPQMSQLAQLQMQMQQPQMPPVARKEMAPPSFSFPMMNMMPHPQQTSNIKAQPVDALRNPSPSDDESERLSDVPSDLESPTPSDFPSPDSKVIELAPAKKPRGRPRKNPAAAAGRVIHI
jgi:hypothetical protein